MKMTYYPYLLSYQFIRIRAFRRTWLYVIHEVIGRFRSRRRSYWLVVDRLIIVRCLIQFLRRIPRRCGGMPLLQMETQVLFDGLVLPYFALLDEGYDCRFQAADEPQTLQKVTISRMMQGFENILRTIIPNFKHIVHRLTKNVCKSR